MPLIQNWENISRDQVRRIANVTVNNQHYQKLHVSKETRDGNKLTSENASVHEHHDISFDEVKSLFSCFIPRWFTHYKANTSRKDLFDQILGQLTTQPIRANEQNNAEKNPATDHAKSVIERCLDEARKPLRSLFEQQKSSKDKFSKSTLLVVNKIARELNHLMHSDKHDAVLDGIANLSNYIDSLLISEELKGKGLGGDS